MRKQLHQLAFLHLALVRWCSSISPSIPHCWVGHTLTALAWVLRASQFKQFFPFFLRTGVRVFPISVWNPQGPLGPECWLMVWPAGAPRCVAGALEREYLGSKLAFPTCCWFLCSRAARRQSQICCSLKFTPWWRFLHLSWQRVAFPKNEWITFLRNEETTQPLVEGEY